MDLPAPEEAPRSEAFTEKGDETDMKVEGRRVEEHEAECIKGVGAEATRICSNDMRLHSYSLPPRRSLHAQRMDRAPRRKGTHVLRQPFGLSPRQPLGPSLGVVQ